MKRLITLIVAVVMLASMGMISSFAADVEPGWFWDIGNGEGQIPGVADNGELLAVEEDYVTFKDHTGDGQIHPGSSVANVTEVLPAINCDVNKVVVVKIRVTAGHDGNINAQTYNHNGNAHGSCAIALEKHSEWQYAILNCTNVADWNTSSVKWFRIDPVNVKDAVADLDWVAMFATVDEANAFIDADKNGAEVKVWKEFTVAKADDLTSSSPGHAILIDPDTYYGVRVNMATEFKGIGFTQWTPGGRKGHLEYKVEVFEWNKDFDTTVAGTAVYTSNHTTPGDGDQPIDFGKEIPAGEYLVLITGTGRFLDADADGTVALEGVRMHMQTGVALYGEDNDKYFETFTNATDYSNGLSRYCVIRFNAVSADTVFAELGVETTPAPGTGDVMSFAVVVAMIALAATVLLKKKAY